MNSCSEHTYHTHQRRSQKAFRSSTDKVFAGVCGGLAEHFGLSSKWLRIAMIVGFILQAPLVIVFYLVCLFILPPENRALRHTRRTREHAPPVYKSPPADKRRSRKAIKEETDWLTNELAAIETKIKILEDHVTSKEYVLNRKFEAL